MTKSEPTKPINYDQKIVSFVDILGFSDEVEKSDSTTLPKLAKKIEEFRRAFESRSRAQAHFEDEHEFFLAFSDCILRGHRTEWSGLFYEVLGFVHGIAQAVHDGHVVRGAITHGSFYYDHSKGILLSPAFIRAYSMEQKQALMPRVIVDPKTLDEFRTNKSWWMQGRRYEHEAESVYGCLRLDTDGFYFVDYLKVIYGELDEPNYEYPDFMERHRNLIVSVLESEKRVDVRKKYIWLANYHNKVLSEFGNGKGTDVEGWKEGKEVPEGLLILNEPPRYKAEDES